MKRANFKTILFGVFVLYSFAAYTQDNTIDSLKKILQSQKEDTNRVNTLNELGKTLVLKPGYNRDYNSVMRYSNEAISLARKINFKKGEAYGYNGICLAYWFQENNPEALKNALIALRLFKECELSELKGTIAGFSLFIGEIYQALYNFNEARRYLLEGLKVWEEVGNKNGIAQAYIRIGALYRKQENFPEALKNHYSALKIYEEAGDKNGIAKIAREIGYIYFDQGNYAEALKSHSSALKSFQEAGDEHNAAVSSKNIGDVYLKLADYSEALKRCMIALNYFENAKNVTTLIALTYNSIGNIYETQGEITFQTGDKTAAKEKFLEALKYYLLGLKINQVINFNVDKSYSNLGNIYIHLNRFSEAKKSLEKSLQIAKKSNSKQIINSVYLNLSRMDSIQGNYKLAYDHYKLYILYRDSLFNDENTRKFEQVKMQYEFDKKEDQITLLSTENKLKTALAGREGQRKKMAYAGIGIILLSGGYSFYRYRRRKRLQSQQTVLNERLRISRELHDEVGSTLSGIAMYSHLAKEQIKANQTTEIEKSLNIMQQSSGEMVNKLNDIVWLINPEQDSFQKLIERLDEYATNMAAIKNMQVKVTVPEKVASINLPVENRRNIYLFCKEAINNAVKYSNGSLLELTIKETEGKLEFSVSDNGKGFDAVMVRRGNGLQNMQKRADEIGGKLTVQSNMSEGARVSMQLKIT